jgi:FKBP-type peptidyl-prolyl cis-trans isomerase 2
MAVKSGDKVKVEYEGRLEDGTVFDASSKHGKPLEFAAGTGQVIKGFDAAVIGMEIGEEKEVTLPPDQAYGQPNDKLVQKIPREKLPQDQQPEVGMVLGMKLPNGAQVPASITEVNDKEVTIDLNPPLAGKTLIFKIKLVSVEPAKA